MALAARRTPAPALCARRSRRYDAGEMLCSLACRADRDLSADHALDIAGVHLQRPAAEAPPACRQGDGGATDKPGRWRRIRVNSSTFAVTTVAPMRHAVSAISRSFTTLSRSRSPRPSPCRAPEDDPGTVEEIGGRGDQTLGRKGALDPIDRTTARRSSMSTTEERKRMARCARPETESACEHPAAGSR